MDEPSTSQAERVADTRRLKAWHWLMILLVVFAVLLVGVRGMIAWRHHSVLSAWQEQGYPTGASDLWAWREEEEGAAEIYGQAIAELRRVGWDIQQEPLPFIWNEPAHAGRLTAEEMANAEAFLRAHAGTLSLLHAAAEAGGGTLPVDRRRYEDLDQMVLEQTWHRYFQDLLFLEAVVLAERGETDQAVRSLEAGSYVAGILRRELTLIDALVEAGMVSLWVRSVSEVLDRVALDEGQLARLQRAAARAALGDHWHKLVPAEGAMWLEQAPQEIAANWRGRLYRWSGTHDLNTAVYLTYLRELERTLAIEDEPDRLHAVGALEDEVTVYWTAPHDAFHFERWRRSLVLRYRVQAEVRALRAALAAKRYTLARGEAPAELADTAPDYLGAVPLDPFTGEPVKYHADSESFVVYSVNDNLVDSSGDDSQNARFQGRDDIVFRIQLAPGEAPSPQPRPPENE